MHCGAATTYRRKTSKLRSRRTSARPMLPRSPSSGPKPLIKSLPASLARASEGWHQRNFDANRGDTTLEPLRPAIFERPQLLAGVDLARAVDPVSAGLVALLHPVGNPAGKP